MPEAVTGETTLLDETVPGRIGFGVTSQGKRWRQENYLDRRGRLCRMWSIEGEPVALDVMQPILDELRSSLQAPCGISVPQATAEGTVDVEFEVSRWTVPAAFGEPEFGGRLHLALRWDIDFSPSAYAVPSWNDDMWFVEVGSAELDVRQALLEVLHGWPEDPPEEP